MVANEFIVSLGHEPGVLLKVQFDVPSSPLGNKKATSNRLTSSGIPRIWNLVCLVQRPASTEVNSVGIVGFGGADSRPLRACLDGFRLLHCANSRQSRVFLQTHPLTRSQSTPIHTFFRKQSTFDRFPKNTKPHLAHQKFGGRMSR
ncbi:MAG: hypothetical protein JWP89_4936 [Schlesneria sp.]|nr:hypothetical protein [Schlesneria sp.]